MEILVLHPGALGDIILSLPALHMLKERVPDARLSLAGNLDFVVPAALGLAARLFSLSSLPLHRLYTNEPLPEADTEFWFSFDRILAWTGSGSVTFERRLREIHPRALVSGWRPVPGQTTHVSQVFAESLRPWIPDTGNLEPPRILLNNSDLIAAQTWLKQFGALPDDRLIAIHPGAGGVSKRWPLRYFGDLIHRLLGDVRIKILLIEGPAEKGAGLNLMRELPAGRILLARELQLGILAAALSQCRAYVGNDSGITHLSAAVGVPSLALFGPTDPEQWAPCGAHVRVLRNRSRCAACQTGAHADHSCMADISVSEVWSQLARLS